MGKNLFGEEQYDLDDLLEDAKGDYQQGFRVEIGVRCKYFRNAGQTDVATFYKYGGREVRDYRVYDTLKEAEDEAFDDSVSVLMAKFPFGRLEGSLFIADPDDTLDR